MTRSTIRAHLERARANALDIIAECDRAIDALRSHDESGMRLAHGRAGFISQNLRHEMLLSAQAVDRLSLEGILGESITAQVRRKQLKVINGGADGESWD